MRRRTWWPAAMPLALVVLEAACGGSSPTSSAPGGSGGTVASHNAGRDCLACHREFGMAGTVYRVDGSAYPGASVRLTTAADGGGSVILTVTADASGNFYASRSVGFGSGLYTEVIGTGGARRAMKASVTGGACNSCHDASNRIRAE